MKELCMVWLMSTKFNAIKMTQPYFHNVINVLLQIHTSVTKAENGHKNLSRRNDFQHLKKDLSSNCLSMFVMSLS